MLRFVYSLHLHLELNRLKIRGKMGMAFIVAVPLVVMLETDWCARDYCFVHLLSGFSDSTKKYPHSFRVRVLFNWYSQSLQLKLGRCRWSPHYRNRMALTFLTPHIGSRVHLINKFHSNYCNYQNMRFVSDVLDVYFCLIRVRTRRNIKIPRVFASLIQRWANEIISIRIRRKQIGFTKC